MDIDGLLAVTPDDLASALLARRQLLSEQLPTVIRTLEAEEQKLAPRMKKVNESHRATNDMVARLKSERNDSQAKAKIILQRVKTAREKLVESGGMINLDPAWKKEKLFEELEDIEEKIQTSALDHKAEKKLLDRRKKIVEENEKWLADRRESNQDMAEYIDAQREMNALYRAADKSHRDMIQLVEKAQPQHDKRIALRDEYREISRQLDRAKELLSQSERAINQWERRLKEGYGALGSGFPDLMDSHKKVNEGGDSSFARKAKKNEGEKKAKQAGKKPQPTAEEPKGGEEE